MYAMVERENVIRIPPERLGDDLDDAVKEITQKTFEGRVENDKSLTVLATNIVPVGDGRIVHGDGAVYQKMKFDALTFKPEIKEVVEGTVCEVLKYGAFIRFGPLDGLLHISQVADDRIDVDADGQRLICKDSKRDLRIGDSVRARVVAVSINERNPRESKIGLTMRQAGLGKLEWLEEDRKEGGPKKPKAKKGKKGKKKKGDGK